MAFVNHLKSVQWTAAVKQSMMYLDVQRTSRASACGVEAMQLPTRLTTSTCCSCRSSHGQRWPHPWGEFSALVGRWSLKGSDAIGTFAVMRTQQGVALMRSHARTEAPVDPASPRPARQARSHPSVPWLSCAPAAPTRRRRKPRRTGQWRCCRPST
jgi:formate-dependent nitrite reductase cytochrome c552 subunit